MEETGALILLASIIVVTTIVISLFASKSKHTISSPEGTASELQRVRVRYVIDGDTVIGSNFWRSIRIRLSAIDCPEDGQPWGNIAKAGLIKLIWGRYVYLEKHGVDDYGRTLATMYIRDDYRPEWINVNERMVMLGHAWVMRQYYNHLLKKPAGPAQ